ncbi:MAG TPA: hypothetical protein VJ925_12540 [Longimicrobiales bacterium]|nr:hypothetical protein [Longimicrobiales bacterium]
MSVDVADDGLGSSADVATHIRDSNYDDSAAGRTFAMVRSNPFRRMMAIQNLHELGQQRSGEAL